MTRCGWLSSHRNKQGENFNFLLVKLLHRQHTSPGKGQNRTQFRYAERSRVHQGSSKDWKLKPGWRWGVDDIFNLTAIISDTLCVLVVYPCAALCPEIEEARFEFRKIAHKWSNMEQKNKLCCIIFSKARAQKSKQSDGVLWKDLGHLLPRVRDANGQDDLRKRLFLSSLAYFYRYGPIIIVGHFGWGLETTPKTKGKVLPYTIKKSFFFFLIRLYCCIATV